MTRCLNCGRYAKPCACGAVPSQSTPDMFDPIVRARIDAMVRKLFSYKNNVDRFIDENCGPKG